MPDPTPPLSGTANEPTRDDIDRITRRWARDSFDETILTPLDIIEHERAKFGLPPFTLAEIREFNP